MGDHRSIELVSQARRELAEAKTINEAKTIADKAELARVLARKAKLGLEAQNEAAEVKIRAERLAGQLIQEGQERGEIASRGNSKSDTVSDLPSLGISHKQSSRWQKEAAIPANDFDQYVEETRADGDELTSAGVRRYADKLNGGRDLGPLMTSQTNEWYTTPDIIQLVTDVMGAIDLDPCSNSKTDPNVPAKHHLTKEDDGLSMPWFGRVYMNPPYGTAIAKWVDKLVSEHESGNVVQAIALTPARPDTRWFRRFRDYPRCFMFGRVRFNDHENSAPFPTMLVGLGCDRAKFIGVMSAAGDIYEWVDR
jgi:hypothetical protein